MSAASLSPPPAVMLPPGPACWSVWLTCEPITRGPSAVMGVRSFAWAPRLSGSAAPPGMERTVCPGLGVFGVCSSNPGNPLTDGVGEGATVRLGGVDASAEGGGGELGGVTGDVGPLDVPSLVGGLVVPPLVGGLVVPPGLLLLPPGLLLLPPGLLLLPPGLPALLLPPLLPVPPVPLPPVPGEVAVSVVPGLPPALVSAVCTVTCVAVPVAGRASAGAADSDDTKTKAMEAVVRRVAVGVTFCAAPVASCTAQPSFPMKLARNLVVRHAT